MGNNFITDENLCVLSFIAKLNYEFKSDFISAENVYSY